MSDFTDTIPILINKTHFVQGSQSTYRYNLPLGGISIKFGDVLSLASVDLYYSWFNITEEEGNNQVSFIFNGTTYNLTLPDGFYTIEDLDSAFQHFFINNNLYLIDSNGNHVYYVKLTTNPVRYRTQLDLFLMPTTLPSGFTDPGSFPFPATSETPQIIINSLFGVRIGFDAGTYPTTPSNVKYEILGQNTPIISTVQSILVRTNLINNGQFSNPSDLLTTFTVPQGTRIGAVIRYEEHNNNMNAQPGKYTFFEIEFTDQLYEPLKLQDKDATILLILKIHK